MINKVNSEINKRLNLIHRSYSGITGSNYNAIFHFVIFSGQIETDEFGNYVPSKSEKVQVKAQIHSIKPEVSVRDVGSDYTRDYYRVWFISPLTYKSEIPEVLDCEILINGSWLIGKFHVVRTNTSNQIEHSGIKKSLGYHIEGTFEQQTNQGA